MNDRQKALMHLLLTRSNEFVHVQTLAEQLNCSDKTIRNDLDRLAEEFAEASSFSFVRKPGKGVSLAVSREEKLRLFHQLYQTRNEHEEMAEMTYQLLVRNKPVTLASLAEKYYTNKMTIKRYFDQIAIWLEQYDLDLVSRQRVGSLVQGSELNKRNALAHLSELVTSEMEGQCYVLQLFPENEIHTVKKALRDLQAQFSFSLTTGEYESLLIHALIMIKRTRQRSLVKVDQDTGRGQAVTMTSYHMTAWFLKRLETMLGLVFPENEHIYYTWHLESCQQMNQIADLARHKLITQVENSIVQKMEQLTMLRFRADSVLSDGLITHLESTINRLQYGLTIRNPMFEDIKKTYPYMFSMVIFAVENINETFELAIPEHEAAFLVLHFQASVERMQEEHTDQKRIVIVCELGVGMAHLLQAKLEQMYNDLIVMDTIKRADVSKFLEDYDIDFIISTIGITDSPVPVLVVSPLLEADDIKRLNQWLYKTNHALSSHEEVVTALRQLLREDAIFLHMQQTHRLEVVEMMANHLVDQGYTDSSFVHSALLRERLSATSIGGAIAIPHARPDFVNESVVATAILPEPLLWGNDQVSVVFLLAISKEDQHRIKPLIQTISSLSQQPDTVEQLREAHSLSDILTTLKQ